MSSSFRRSKKLAAWAFGSLMLVVEGPAFAWDGVVSGTIATVQITAGQNFGFRLFLNGVTTMCTGGPNWAYLNEADSNYKTYVAAFLLAKAQGNTVAVYTTLENGQCHIGYISIS